MSRTYVVDGGCTIRDCIPRQFEEWCIKERHVFRKKTPRVNIDLKTRLIQIVSRTGSQSTYRAMSGMVGMEVCRIIPSRSRDRAPGPPSLDHHPSTDFPHSVHPQDHGIPSQRWGWASKHILIKDY